MHPSTLLPTLLALLATLPLLTHQLGINCRGSSQCATVFESTAIGDHIQNFNQSLWSGNNNHLPNGPINPDAIYLKGQHIMCARNSHIALGSICLFTQGHVPILGVPGYIIKEKISELAAHGCSFCGSVPLGPTNDPRTFGILTSNYVLDKDCQGLCSQGYIPSVLPAVSPVDSFPKVNGTGVVTTTTSDPVAAPPTEDPQTRHHPGFGGVP